jgi:hypothetical protein
MRRIFALMFSLALVAGARMAAAQFSLSPIGAAPVPTYDDWNLFVPGDQPPVFAGQVVDRRQQLTLNLLVPAGDVMAMLGQLDRPFFLPGSPAPTDEVGLLFTVFWDSRREPTDPPGEAALGAGINLAVQALSPIAGAPGVALNNVVLATLTSNQALADTFNARAPGGAVVADHLSILASRDFAGGQERTGYLVRVKHRNYGINATLVAAGNPAGIQIAQNPIETPLGRLRTLAAGASGQVGPAAEILAQFASGDLSEIYLVGRLGTPFGGFGKLRVNPDATQSRAVDLEFRTQEIE